MITARHDHWGGLLLDTENEAKSNKRNGNHLREQSFW